MVKVDLLVIGTEGHIVHVEEEVTSSMCTSIAMSCDSKCLGSRGAASRGVLEVWGRLGKIILSRVSDLAFHKARRPSYITTLAIIVGSRFRLRCSSCVGIFVIDGSQSVGVMGGITRGTEIRPHPNGRVGWACSRHNDIGSLTNTESDHISNVWLNRHKIVCNDRHIEAINGETLDTFGTAVDEPESVLLAGVELELGKTGIR